MTAEPAPGMTLFATYHHYSLSTDALIGASSSLSNRNGGVNDFSQVVVGTKIEF